MSNGVVLKIFTTPEPGGEMNSVGSVIAVENKGLIGDRYYSLTGTYSKPSINPDQEVSLIESEAFEELFEKHGIELQHSQSRRNILTRYVDLNSLVGKTFQVGEVTLTGMRLCEPCVYLSGLTGHPRLVKQWMHRAGLRAHIAKGGTINVGDQVLTP